MEKLLKAKEITKTLLQNKKIAESPEGKKLQDFLDGKANIVEAINATRKLQKSLPLPQ